MIHRIHIQVGKKVHYIDPNTPNEFQNGIIKEIPEHTTKEVRVVYNCNNEWDRYQEYTSQLTPVSMLDLGWVEKTDYEEF